MRSPARGTAPAVLRSPAGEEALMDTRSTRKEDRVDYVFVAPDPGRRVVRLLLVLSLIGLCVGVTLSVSDRQMWTLLLGGISAVGLVVCWAMLQSSIPQRITVRGPHVQIRRDGRVDSFDLEDPGVDIRVKDGEIAFAHYMDRWVVVRSARRRLEGLHRRGHVLPEQGRPQRRGARPPVQPLTSRRDERGKKVANRAEPPGPASITALEAQHDRGFQRPQGDDTSDPHRERGCRSGATPGEPGESGCSHRQRATLSP